jgi:hypothetical protein
MRDSLESVELRMKMQEIQLPPLELMYVTPAVIIAATDQEQEDKREINEHY